MTPYFLDSSVCFDFLKGRLGSGYQALRTGDAHSFKLPAIVGADLFAGAQQTGDPSRHVRLVEDFVEAFDVMPFDANCAREYGRIRYELEHQGRHGKLIGERAMMVAATACAHRAVLVASASTDLLRVPGLELETWSDR